MIRFSLCDHWDYVDQWTEAFAAGEGPSVPVRLPHSVGELPLHGADEADYQRVSGYRRTLSAPAAWKGQRVFARFDGAAHEATVFLNGRQVAVHAGGYTAFRAELTDALTFDGPNLLTVRLDSRETLNIPPFGHVIDYMTFGGLYREVWCEVAAPSHIADVFVRTPDPHRALVNLALEAPQGATGVDLRVLTPDGAVAANLHVGPDALATTLEDLVLDAPGVRPWDLESPVLHTLEVVLKNGDTVVDQRSVRFGFRQAEFRRDGFFLNGRRVKLRGLNRHQAWPYVGYAMPASLQRHDAEVLKHELQVNCVRTSHYPQSQHFLDRCDELGLLVFTEIPGWQHIGNQEWQDRALVHVEEMVLQYRNHPSIILWGVRINESQDSDAFYRRTNALARTLDPSRATSGVRFLWKSQLHEDVYAFNDFSHGGTNGGLLPKWFVSPDPKKAYLISEFNGHMFPTKTYDDAPHRLDQALRHATVLDAVYGNPAVAGGLGWCMTDYYTHGDFGSGDRICYHGVMDMHRNPKLAAAVYASNGDGAPVLAVGSDMQIGDYPAGSIGPITVFTNADAVRFYKGDRFIKEFPALRRRWKHLPHPPIEIDDTIGDALELGEGWKHGKAEAIKASMLAVRRYGVKLPVGVILVTIGRMVRYGVGPKTLVKLYLKYAETWGVVSPVYRFEAIKDGQVVASATKQSSARLHLEASASHTDLAEGDTYDVASVRLRVADHNGNTAAYSSLALNLTVSGPATLIGPSVVTAEGGLCGTYVKTTGAPGPVTLTVQGGQAGSLAIQFTVTIRKPDEN